MQAAFLADGEETGDRYSVSLWWVDPGRPGPGAHAHAANDELFYVVEGTLTFLVGDRHVDAPAGTFLRVPAGVRHDFANRTAERAGALNVFIPGGSRRACRRSWRGARRSRATDAAPRAAARRPRGRASARCWLTRR